MVLLLLYYAIIAIMRGFLRVALCSLYIRAIYPPKPWYSAENRPQHQKLYAPLLANGVWITFTSYRLH